ncbi:FMN-binding protein [Candidatus Kaiserbacteria bacterium]|nr:FMN-binding protein [Candidatus Kaiserbacteria bacterium]
MKNTKEMVVFAGVIAVVIIAFTALQLNSSSTGTTAANLATTESASTLALADTTTTNEQTTAATTNNTNSTNTTTNNSDGTYTTTASYLVPHGTESMSVTVTVADNIITAVDVTHSGSDRESQQYQNRFDKNIESAVIGKNIDSLTLSRVGGASLTTQAFKNAITKIATQLT